MTINPSGPGDPVRARRRGRRDLLAWSLSLALHGLAALVLAGSASGDLMAASGAGLDQGDMTVSLVRASDLPAATAGGERSGDLRPLLAKYANDQAPVAVDPTRSSSDLDDLFRRVADRQPRADPNAEPPGPDPRMEPPAPAAPTASRAAGEDGVRPDKGAARSGAPGALWGAIEPCWRELPGRSAVPVILEVSLDLGGAMTTPPRILRHRGSVVDERRLQAEARALSALAACLPRRDLRLGGQIYRLEFRPNA